MSVDSYLATGDPCDLCNDKKPQACVVHCGKGMNIEEIASGRVIARWQIDRGWTHAGLVGDQAWVFMGWFGKDKPPFDYDDDLSSALSFCKERDVQKYFPLLKVVH